MEPVETVHLTAKDLLCPVCYQKYDLSAYQPMSLSCGHNLCSHCLRKVRNCPLCRGKIYNRSCYSKNVLISCILEQKNKIRECKVHNRPLEFFCKEHKQLVCVDCAIEGNHFSHDFVRSRDVEKRAEKIKTLMKKVDTKEEQSTTKFKSFLEKEKKTLKRKLDDVIDEFLEPIIMVKKKLHKEIDTFMLAQGGTFDKHTIRETILKWKKENEAVLGQWESKGEASAASHIVSNETEEIEKKLGQYDSQLEKIQGDTLGNSEILIKDIKSRISHARGPWTKLKKKLGQIMTTFNTEPNPKVEREYLLDFLKESGFLASWGNDEEEEVLEIKKDNEETPVKEFEPKYFDCTLEKLRVRLEKSGEKRFDIICKVIERILKLTDLNVSLPGVSDEDVLRFGESLKKIKSLEKLGIFITSEHMSEKSFQKLLTILPGLPKLGSLNIELEDCDDLANEEAEGLELAYGKMEALKEFSLRLVDCDSISNEGFNHYLKGLSRLAKLNKLSLAICDCKGLTYKIFESFGKVLTALKNLEELNLVFEGFYELPNSILIVSLANSIASLSKLKKLSLSFAENIYLPPHLVKRLVSKITQQLTLLREFSLDLSRCKEIVNGKLEAIGESIALLPQLRKLTLRLRMCNISEKGIIGLCTILSKINSLRSLTLDCRYCKLIDESVQGKIMEHVNKMTKLTEKEVLFGPECKQDQSILNTHSDRFSQTQSSRHERIPWSPLEISPSFREELEEAALENYGFYGNDLSYEDELDESLLEGDYAVMSIHSSDLGF